MKCEMRNEKATSLGKNKGSGTVTRHSWNTRWALIGYNPQFIGIYFEPGSTKVKVQTSLKRKFAAHFQFSEFVELMSDADVRLMRASDEVLGVATHLENKGFIGRGTFGIVYKVMCTRVSTRVNVT
jgi:hypothetical protein